MSLRKFHITTPILSPYDKKILSDARVFDEIIISEGSKIFTLRDASAKKLTKDHHKKSIELSNSAIYFCAPSHFTSDSIGACGPTTSQRMAEHIPFLINKGVKIFIGKGPLPKEILTRIKKNKCLYLLAIGGAGAYYSQFVKSCRIAAYAELGPEAILELTVSKFPLIVGIDSKGRSAFNLTQN